MIDLKQKELKKWQDKNFPDDDLFKLSKDELIHIIRLQQMALGVNEEAGELAHHVLKGIQKIRGGTGGIDMKAAADSVADGLVFGTQLCSLENTDAESAIEQTIDEVLARDWINNPAGEGLGALFQAPKKEEEPDKCIDFEILTCDGPQYEDLCKRARSIGSLVYRGRLK